MMPREAEDVPEIGVSARIGVDYAKQWREEELRFFDKRSGAVSRARRITALKGRSRVGDQGKCR
jgi:3-methyladenine DNA glycosylase Mpg